MLLKLSLSGIKSKLKDYIVLLVGLVMSSSIFYMFETLAMNDAFLKQNSMISAVSFVFQAGSVLLGIITIVYILYANTFLLSLRQKEYGMYMTLGAKKKKIGKMMFIETMILGLASIVIGIVIGIGLSQVVGQLLMHQLDFNSPNYHALYVPAMLVTIIFYLILFIVSACVNLIKLSKLSALTLIHGETKADHIVLNPKKMTIQSIISLILLAIGYFMMIKIVTFQFIGIIVALITITAGTFLFFKTALPFLVEKLKANKKISEKKINIFTFSQLSFRVNDLTKVLAMVAMLIALAVGAITVGFAFQNSTKLTLDQVSAYDIVTYNPTQKETKIMDEIQFDKKTTYHYKTDGQVTYFVSDEMKKNPPLIGESQKMEDGSFKTTFSKINEPIPENQLLNPKEVTDENSNWLNALGNISNGYDTNAEQLPIKLVSKEAFDALSQKENQVVVGNTNDYLSYLKQFKAIYLIEKTRYPKTEYTSSKYETYTGLNSLSSGTVFMGLFLGFAFLAMMASCLMFKVLTGATSDTKRYTMLGKIGVRKSLLVASIYKEMAMIFIFPAVIGAIHVLIGMQMFKFLLPQPYYKIWVPFAIFAVIYGIYYFITVFLYKGIVLKGEEEN
ncbi:ABC transporter permease [Carnobacterium divergens]|uniref:ABC transporter permease n=1 Tax=Carnobacterium divergens TaxID=2748 RepID=A0AAW8R7H6_CARDV|nr:ABC transporter permease [Carnobacterium divergens]AOA00164.1 ABC transporter permease [Carnobacterium divergens]MDT1957526.1 ABC transporter permease [Carnobacterium divergens]MDT1973729.1 ABC transporter permease [Carnobacterium divergens]MDT2011072.1 ABC transporter permease [Carnobacterium divergens]